MTQWTVRAVHAHNGQHAWTKENISRDGPVRIEMTADEALAEFLNEYMPARPATLLVWIIDEHNNDCEMRTIGLN